MLIVFVTPKIEEEVELLVVILLELLHMFIPDGLSFDFSEKASSITLSRVSWSREMYGIVPSFVCCCCNNCCCGVCSLFDEQ